MQRARLKKKAQGGSKPFRERPTIAANGQFGYAPDRNEDEGDVLKVGGFDKIKISNKSSNDIVVELGMNPRRARTVQAGTQQIFTDIQPFRSYKVKNLGGSQIPAGDLDISVKLQALNSDEQARQEYQQKQANNMDPDKALRLAGLFT